LLLSASFGKMMLPVDGRTTAAAGTFLSLIAMTDKVDNLDPALAELQRRYEAIKAQRRLGRHTGYPFLALLGRGGQGRVYLTEYGGSDGFRYEAAIKVFSPKAYSDVDAYEEGMRRMARVASLVAHGNHDNLMGVRRFEQFRGIRTMLMEYIDGYDLRQLISVRRHRRLQSQTAEELWNEINSVVVMAAERQLRLTPGVAVNIIRDCLYGLDWLHRQGIVHGDIKPANIMVCHTGKAKIIDLGSAFLPEARPRQRIFTRAYAAPEVLQKRPCTPQSDLASLGYVLVELLAGRRVFAAGLSGERLVEEKSTLPERLTHLLPREMVECEVLMNLCRGLIEPDPSGRFENAERAHLDPKRGAHQFLQELVLGRLGTAFPHHLSRWIQAMKQAERRRGGGMDP